MTRRVAWVILCEDEQQYAFANRFLNLLAEPELRVCRKVLGPGHQGVRARLGLEVLGIRKQGGRSALLAIVDTDTFSVAERRSYALDLCAKDEVPGPEDPVAVLIPKRNIETWITWLQGAAVNEDVCYPKLKRERDCQSAVEKLKAICSDRQMPAEAPTSIHHACREFQRVLAILRGPT